MRMPKNNYYTEMNIFVFSRIERFILKSIRLIIVRGIILSTITMLYMYMLHCIIQKSISTYNFIVIHFYFYFISNIWIICINIYHRIYTKSLTILSTVVKIVLFICYFRPLLSISFPFLHFLCSSSGEILKSYASYYTYIIICVATKRNLLFISINFTNTIYFFLITFFLVIIKVKI